MKKSLNINATRNGKKVSTSIGYVNPDVANSIAGGFAQMVNALTTNTFVNAEVVKKMDTTEEEQQSGGGGTGLLDPNLHIDDKSSEITWLGNGVCKKGDGTVITKGVLVESTVYVLESDGTYDKDWISNIY